MKTYSLDSLELVFVIVVTIAVLARLRHVPAPYISAAST